MKAIRFASFLLAVAIVVAACQPAAAPTPAAKPTDAPKPTQAAVAKPTEPAAATSALPDLGGRTAQNGQTRSRRVVAPRIACDRLAADLVDAGALLQGLDARRLQQLIVDHKGEIGHGTA